MIDSDVQVRPVWPVTLVLSVVTAGLVVAATFIMFSAFMIYDDEGYVLISLRNFAEHGRLYRDVYTQYGPFPFVFYYVVQAIGIPITHTVGRLITIGMWTGAAWWCASLTGYATRSLVMRLAVLAAVFLYLWIMSSEPTHPGGIIVLLTAMLAALGYRWISNGKRRHWAVLIGAGTAILVLTKINIGAFVAFSAGTWWLLHHQNDGIRRWAPVLAGVCAVLLPVALMRPLLGTPWVQTYAFVFACSAVATVLATTVGATGVVGWRTLVTGLLSGTVVAAVVLSVVFLRGTSAHDLLEGLILGPLRQPTNFSLRFNWPAGIEIVATVSVLGCAAACILRRRGVRGVDTVIAWLRIIVALALAGTIARFPAISPDYPIFGSAMPCIWVCAWPLADEDRARSSARAWVALLLLGQCLHVFPVPGSQIAWGSLLTIPLAALAGWDAAKWLTREKAESWFASHRAATAAGLLMFGFVALTGWKFAQLATRFRGGQNVGLPGAELIHVPDRPAALLRVLTENAAAHADVLFSLPGMFSFNLWSDVPTPTLANVTHWFSLLNDRRQQEIVDALKTHPRACVIVDRAHVIFLTKRGLAPRGLLYDYLMSDFEPAFGVGHFEFFVHHGRQIAPFLLADLFTRTSAADDKITLENSLLKFALSVPPIRPISTIELVPDEEAIPRVTLHAKNSRAEIRPINSRGEPTRPARPAPWPIALPGPASLSIYYDRERNGHEISPATIILRDEAGAEIGLARIRL